MKRGVFSYLIKQGARELFSLWKQFLAIIAIGAIAVTLFVGLQANADSFAMRVDAIYQSGNMADSFVTTNPIKGNQNDLSNLKLMFADEADIEGRFYSYARLNGTNAYCGISAEKPTICKPSNIVKEIPGEEEGDFFYVDSLLVGRENTVEHNSRCVVGEVSQIEFDLSSFVDVSLISDDLIESIGLNDHLLPGVSIEDTLLKKPVITLDIMVTGSMNHPENVVGSTYTLSVFLLSSKSFAKAFDAYLARFFDEEGIDLCYDAIHFSPLGWDRNRENLFPIPNQFLLKGREGFDVKEANTRINDYFKAKTDEDYNLIMLQERSDTSCASVMDMDVLQARQLTFVFPFVFFAVAILVILTTMSQLILKERTQIGTLKALGLNKSAISRYYQTITTIVVGTGILIGEILGPIIIPMIMDHKYTLLYNIPKASYYFPWVAGITTAAIFLFLANLVAFLTVRKEASLLPVESMRPPVKVYKGIGEKHIKKSKSKFRFAFLMAMRNIRGNFFKSSMVVLGILGCTALLCVGFGIDDTISYGVANDIFVYNGADATATLTSTIEKEKIMADLHRVLGDDVVLSVQGSSRGASEISHDGKTMSSYFNIYSMPDSKNPDDVTNLPFSWNPDELLLTKKVSDRIGAKIGDTVSFTFGNRTIEGKVGAIRDIFYSNGVYADSDSIVFEDEPVKAFSSYLLRVKPGTDIKAMGTKLRENLGYVGAVTTSVDNRNTVEGIVSSIGSITIAIKVFAILLAIVVLYNISVLNYTERSRDIATMKVLGFNKLEIASSLLSETLTLTLVGVVLGLFVGFPFLMLVLFINQVEVISYIITIYPISYFLAFLLTFVVSALINIYLSSRTNRIKMVESLKSVE